MTQRVGEGRAGGEGLERRARARGVLALASLLSAACASDAVSGPRGGAEGISASVVGSALLGSIGDTVRVTIQGVGGSLPGGAPVHWRSSDPSILVSLGDGAFRAEGNGEVLVIASIDPALTGVRPTGYYATRLADSVRVEVRQAPASVALASPFDARFRMVGTVRTLPVRVADARGNTVPSSVAAVTFRSSDSTVVRVDAAGRVTSVADGSAEVVLTAGDRELLRTAVTVDATRSHVSCVTYVRRKQRQQLCATRQFVVRDPAAR